ncbi:MAG: radical SAM protein [Candidatus Buchananbacteria bacterium]
MKSDSTTIILIIYRLSGFRRICIALEKIPSNRQIIIVGYISNWRQGKLRKIYSEHKIIFANKSAGSKDILKTLILLSTELIIFTDVFCQLTAEQINRFESAIYENPDKLIVANLLPLLKNNNFEDAKKVEQIFMAADCTPFTFRPIAGLGLSRALLQKLNQMIVQIPVDKEQQKNLLLDNYPKLILKLKKVSKFVLSIDLDLTYNFVTSRVALIIKAIINGYQLETLTKQYPYVGESSNSRLHNFKKIIQSMRKKDILNFENTLKWFWIMGMIVEKIFFKIIPRYSFSSLVSAFKYGLKNARILEWRTNCQVVEIELTSYCDINCFNCDRNIRQAPTNEHISLEQIKKFVQESIDLNYPWKRIALLGGEPTLHPQFYEIINELQKLHLFNPSVRFGVVTNGFSEKAQNAIKWLPAWIAVLNSAKTSQTNSFCAINLAPIDYNIKYNFNNACGNTEFCGLGLSRYGFFLCGPGASIARVFGLDIGLKSLTEVKNNSKELWNQREQICRYCGGMKDFHRKHLITEERMSPVWTRACENYKSEKPSLSLY